MSRIRLLSFVFVVSILFVGCAATHKANRQITDHIELPYRAFGSSSESIIWPQHWQWQDAENHKPVSYDIRVIVYQGNSLEKLKTEYQVIPEKKQDYRFIEREKAIDFLLDTISELESTLFNPSDESDCDFDMVYFKEITTLYKTLVNIEQSI